MIKEGNLKIMWVKGVKTNPSQQFLKRVFLNDYMVKIEELALETRVVIRRGARAIPEGEDFGKTFPTKMMGLVTSIDAEKRRARVHFYHKGDPYWLTYEARDLTIAPEGARY